MRKLMIVDCETKHIAEIQNMVSDHFSNVSIIKELDFKKETDADLIIISGGSHIPSVMYNAEKHQDILDFIKTTDIPILGICFGCELIARAFDCELSDSGIKKIETQDVCFDNKKFCIEAFEAHRFFIQSVGEKIKIIAQGNNNSIEVIQHKSKPIMGTQFHPEISEMNKEIFQYLLNKIL